MDLTVGSADNSKLNLWTVEAEQQEVCFCFFAITV